MPDWPCSRCGEVNLESQRVCTGCGNETRRQVTALRRVVAEGYQRLEMPAARPCSREQNKAAYRVLQDVLERRIDTAEGRKRLAAIFAMPELEALS